MNKTYFHALSTSLQIGSVVLPGNWGRMVKQYSPNAGAPWILVRELIFEAVRVKYYSELPSRLESVFLCETEEELQQFCTSNQRKFDIGYEVEIVRSDALFHRADLTLANLDNLDTFETFEKRAMLYWNTKDISKVEVLTNSPVKIIRRIW